MNHPDPTPPPQQRSGWLPQNTRAWTAVGIMLLGLFTYIAHYFTEFGQSIWEDIISYLLRGDYSNSEANLAVSTFVTATLVIPTAPFLHAFLAKSRLMFSGYLVISLAIAGIWIWLTINHGGYEPEISLIAISSTLTSIGLLVLPKSRKSAENA